MTQTIYWRERDRTFSLGFHLSYIYVQVCKIAHFCTNPGHISKLHYFTQRFYNIYFIFNICIKNIVAAYYQFVMLLWRDFIYKEICEGYARKSSKWFYNSAPKVEQYYLQSLTYLTRVNIKYNSSATTSLSISSHNNINKK
jgi:hypothetical protein